MGGAMNPLCYPRQTEKGIEIVIVRDEQMIVSHNLNFAECKAIAETCIRQMQELYVKEKCKCE
jgi:hypothetical protein